MGTIKNPKKNFPSVLDSAYEQYQHELELTKLVEEIMSREVITINPESTMDEAAGIMGEKHIGSLIVTEYESPVGIVTERDLLSKVLAKDKDLQKATVESVMSYPLVTICSNAKIKEAARMMIDRKSVV